MPKKLGGSENKGKGCILDGLKSDRTYYDDKSMKPGSGRVDDNPTRSSPPMNTSYKGGGRKSY